MTTVSQPCRGWKEKNTHEAYPDRLQTLSVTSEGKEGVVWGRGRRGEEEEGGRGVIASAR